MPQQLPLTPSVPNYRFTTELAGDAFVIDIRWNTREAAWYMDILDEDEDPIMNGLKLTLGAPVGARSVDPRKPQGLFMVADLSGTSMEPGLDDMGDRVVVLFFPFSELEG